MVFHYRGPLTDTGRPYGAWGNVFALFLFFRLVGGAVYCVFCVSQKKYSDRPFRNDIHNEMVFPTTVDR